MNSPYFQIDYSKIQEKVKNPSPSLPLHGAVRPARFNFLFVREVPRDRGVSNAPQDQPKPVFSGESWRVHLFGFRRSEAEAEHWGSVFQPGARSPCGDHCRGGACSVPGCSRYALGFKKSAGESGGRPRTCSRTSHCKPQRTVDS